MKVEAASLSLGGVARLSFGMPKNVSGDAIAPEKPRSTPEWRAIWGSRWSQIVKKRIEKSITK